MASSEKMGDTSKGYNFVSDEPYQTSLFSKAELSQQHGLSTLIAVKTEEHLDIPMESAEQSFSSPGLKIEQNCSPEPPADDGEHVIWIKAEKVDLEFEDESHFPGGNYKKKVMNSDEDAVSSQAEGTQYSCPHCDDWTGAKEAVTGHIRSQHPNKKPHACPRCDYRTEKSGNLTRHIVRNHIYGKLFSCSLCGARAKSRERLKKHIKSRHSKDMSFPCLQCDFSAADTNQLKYHTMAVHTDIKSYSCPDCDYRTVKLGNMKAHIMAKHSKERPYSCPHCDYRATQNVALKKHIRAKHRTNLGLV